MSRRTLQRLTTPATHSLGVPTVAPPIVHEVLRSPGQSLDAATRAFMEPRFGQDFSRVRVHTDARAAESARAVNAHAYTVGSHIAFGTGQYAPGTGEGKRLLAHELVHTLQQQDAVSRAPAELSIQVANQRLEQEADSAATFLDAGHINITHSFVSSATQLQCQTHETDSSTMTVELENERNRFTTRQEGYFRFLGDIGRRSILIHAGAGPHGPLTRQATEQILALWRLTPTTLAERLPEIRQSTDGRVRSRRVAMETIARQQAQLVAGLSPRGQQTYHEMLRRVQDEPFWRQHLTDNTIYIFVSNSGRYRGYTQSGTSTDASGRVHPIYIIHIDRALLEEGAVEESAELLVHELSHTLYQPNITQRMLNPLHAELAELLADIPEVAALRQDITDTAAARQRHVRLIIQLLFEHTGYAEEEIFVHLQQLTHQPHAASPSDILDEVKSYVRQLRRIGLPLAMVEGVLRSLRRRTAGLFDRRIAATPDRSLERRRLEFSKRQALTILSIALRNQVELE